jgi:hypothetical protein
MQQVATASNRKLRPVYNKLKTIVAQRAFCNINNKSKRMDSTTANAFVTLQAFVKNDPCELACTNYLRKNLSDVALVATGGWAQNIKKLQTLLNN